MALEPSDVDYCLDVLLSPGEVVGLSFTTQSGSMSAVAVVGLLGVITLNLLLADLFMSFGAILDARWANSGKVYCGCWISPRYKVQRLIGEYVWLWVAGFGSILLYTPLFFMLRGDITWDPQIGWRSLRWNRRIPEPEPEQGDGSSVASSQSGVSPFALLWYPLAYTLCVLPMSVVRWITFGHKDNPSSDVVTATFVAVFIFNLSGLANVVLIRWTRAGVLLLDSEPDGDGEHVPRPRQEKRSVSPSSSPEASPRQETGFGGPCLAMGDRSSDFDTGRVNRAGRHQHGLSDGSSGSGSGAYK